MNVRKALLWGLPLLMLPVLIVPLVAASILLEVIYQGRRQATCTTPVQGTSVDAIPFADQGRAWIGTDEGVRIHDGETWRTY